MAVIKIALNYIATQIRKELTIQKPAPEQIRPHERNETRQERILKNGLNGFAMIGLIIVGCAILVL